MQCFFRKYTLHFKKPGGTSRGILSNKDTYFIFFKNNDNIAIGECNRFTGLSYDDKDNYEDKLKEVCRLLPDQMENLVPTLHEWPSLSFGVETVIKDFRNGCSRIIFPEVLNNNTFSIPINGLIWMGSKDDMKEQISARLKEGFTSIKLKIGAIDFDTELELIQFIRKQFSEKEVEIRTDANGAFSYPEAKEKIKRLSEYGISYIEQPIKAGLWQEMAALADNSPVKIALDEELIGVLDPERQQDLIQTIAPQLLILKPALLGGFKATDQWRRLIEKNGGSWVLTSALESNIGLNAIAQYTALGWSDYAQGLGTGSLYTNNIPSPYTADAQGLHYQPQKNWDLSLLV